MSLARKVFSKRTLAWTSGGCILAAAAGGGYWYSNTSPAYPRSTKENRRPPPPWTPPSRAQMLNALKNATPGSQDDGFDLFVIGGGATGAGVALDAASRGLKVAVVEMDDFSAGASSKSTKLVHGGVRYLQKAILELDYGQYKLVREALHERRIFLQTAPYLSAMLPIMLPIYQYWKVPYYWVGCKLYDTLAGRENMESSYLMSKGKALEAFPMLKSDGLVGALVYYDGQHNDSRMNVALIMSAVKHGAVVANHCEVTGLHKDDAGKLNGVRVKDNLTGDEWDVRAKGIINATGPFSDTLLAFDNPSHKHIVQPSAGIHITLPNYYSPRTMGLLDPSTSDGRVIFFLPWQGNTIAGTTDSAAVVEREPRAREEEIRWVLEEVRRYLSPDIKVRRGDVLSAWSGLRPLVRNPSAGKTEGLVRSHLIHVSDSGLLTIAGGKWTTYRAMAEETVDVAIKTFGLEGRVRNGCVTERLRLVGSDGWSRTMFIGLIQRFGLETDVAKHLSDSYGDRAWTVCSLAVSTGERWPLHGIRLSPEYPYIEAEVRYAVRYEYAQTAIDVLARRTRLSFLDAQGALDALPRVVDIMAEELGWTRGQKRQQIENAMQFLSSMGLAPDAGIATAVPDSAAKGLLERALWRVGSGGWFWPWAYKARSSVEYSRARFEAGEVEELRRVFVKRAERVGVGEGVAEEERIKKVELVEVLKEVPGYEDVQVKDCEYVLEEAGFSRRLDVNFDEFIEICGTMKEVSLAPVKVRKHERRRRIPVEMSGGGV